MGFYVALVYLAFLIFSPGAVIPEIAAYRVQWIVGGLATLVTAALLPYYGYPIRNLQVKLMVLFMMQISLSRLMVGWMGGAVYAIAEFGSTAIVFFLLIAVPPTVSRLRLIAITLALPAYYAVLRGILAVYWGIGRETYILFQNLFDINQAIVDVVERVKFLGFFGDPNDLSQYFLVVVPFVVLIWKRGAFARNLVTVVPLLLYLFFGMYLTHSRGVLVGLLVVTMLYLRERFNKVTMSILSAALGVLLISANFAGGRAISFGAGSDRIEAWGAGLTMLRTHPLFGVGYNLFLDHNDLTAHNSFVLCFAELGLIGFFIWLSLIVSTVMGLTQFLRRFRGVAGAEQMVRWATAVRVSLCGFLVTGWFLSRTYSILLYVLIAMWIMLERMGHQFMAAQAAAPQQAQPEPQMQPARVYAPRPTRPWHWAPTVAVIQITCLVIVYIMVRARWLN